MEEPTVPPDEVSNSTSKEPVIIPTSSANPDIQPENEKAPTIPDENVKRGRNLGTYALLFSFYLIIFMLTIVLPPHLIHYVFTTFVILLLIYINLNVEVDQVNRVIIFVYGLIIIFLLMLITTGEGISPVSITETVSLNKYIIIVSVIPLIISFHPVLVKRFDEIFSQSV